MKCIKAIKSLKNTEVGTIKRVDDVEAETKVLTGYWKYTSKSDWKATQSKKEEVKVETGKVFADNADKVITVKKHKKEN